MKKKTAKTTDSVCVLNSLSWRRQDVAEVTVQAPAAPKSLIGPQGQCTQRTPDDGGLMTQLRGRHGQPQLGEPLE